MTPTKAIKGDTERFNKYMKLFNGLAKHNQSTLDELLNAAYDNGVMDENDRLTARSNRLTIETNRDAHDDTYYEITEGSFIVAERMNRLSDVILLVNAKLNAKG